MKIILIRHGKTYSNIINKDKTVFFIGSLNNHLTDLAPEGKNQAKKIAKSGIMKDVQTIYCSDLNRTVETAQIINSNSKIIKTKELRERNLGIFEGMETKVFRENKQYHKYIDENDKYNFQESFDITAPEGENYNDVINRTRMFLNNLNMKEDITICIVSHYHTIRCMLYNLLNIKKEDILKIKIKNCTPYVLEGKELRHFKIISNNLELQEGEKL